MLPDWSGKYVSLCFYQKHSCVSCQQQNAAPFSQTMLSAVSQTATNFAVFVTCIRQKTLAALSKSRDLAMGLVIQQRKFTSASLQRSTKLRLLHRKFKMLEDSLVSFQGQHLFWCGTGNRTPDRSFSCSCSCTPSLELFHHGSWSPCWMTWMPPCWILYRSIWGTLKQPPSAMRWKTTKRIRRRSMKSCRTTWQLTNWKWSRTSHWTELKPSLRCTGRSFTRTCWWPWLLWSLRLVVLR